MQNPDGDAISETGEQDADAPEGLDAAALLELCLKQDEAKPKDTPSSKRTARVSRRRRCRTEDEDEDDEDFVPQGYRAAPQQADGDHYSSRSSASGNGRKGGGGNASESEFAVAAAEQLAAAENLRASGAFNAGSDFDSRARALQMATSPTGLGGIPDALLDFSQVKGVYKNCRGIWAAQWTDEKGQRHTKYFNPKFFPSENDARVAAYKFKMAIMQEIERKGGVQRQRTRNSEPYTRRYANLVGYNEHQQLAFLEYQRRWAALAQHAAQWNNYHLTQQQQGSPPNGGAAPELQGGPPPGAFRQDVHYMPPHGMGMPGAPGMPLPGPGPGSAMEFMRGLPTGPMHPPPGMPKVEVKAVKGGPVKKEPLGG